MDYNRDLSNLTKYEKKRKTEEEKNAPKKHRK